VTLFASGDSVTSARLVPCAPRALRLSRCTDALAHHIRMLECVAQQFGRFEIVHFHIDYLHYPVSRRHSTPHVTTLHGRLDLPDLQPLYREFDDVPLVSISDAQRAPLPWVNWQATIYHGLPGDLHRFREQAGNYLAFLGRISPEKRVDRAIEIARRAGMKLRIAAKVDQADLEYFETEIKPLLEDSLVDYVGELGGDEKDEFLGNARALLFPIDWPEPFGLVMIESMACGTPVIAFDRGSVPEVIDDGLTGFIVNDVDEAVRAVARIPEISRRECRRTFERRFSARRMTTDYLEVYRRVLGAGRLARTA
jgi:glycosyltransferase involved in cell wall biosynthesis